MDSGSGGPVLSGQRSRSTIPTSTCQAGPRRFSRPPTRGQLRYHGGPRQGHGQVNILYKERSALALILTATGLTGCATRCPQSSRLPMQMQLVEPPSGTPASDRAPDDLCTVAPDAPCCALGDGWSWSTPRCRADDPQCLPEPENRAPDARCYRPSAPRRRVRWLGRNLPGQPACSHDGECLLQHYGRDIWCTSCRVHPPACYLSTGPQQGYLATPDPHWNHWCGCVHNHGELHGSSRSEPGRHGDEVHVPFWAAAQAPGSRWSRSRAG